MQVPFPYPRQSPSLDGIDSGLLKSENTHTFFSYTNIQDIISLPNLCNVTVSIPCSAVQRNALQFTAVQKCSILFFVMQCTAVECNSVQYCAVKG